MDPLLSIILPSYNYAQYLPSALDSILAQDFRDFEILLTDDGSTDESPKISEAYAMKDNRIRYARHATNLGIFVRVKEALAVARGKYIHYFSADDLYLPGFLSKMMGEFTKKPELGLACCDIGYFKNDLHSVEIKKLLKFETSPCYFSPKQLIKVFQSTDFWVPGSTCIVRKELISKHEAHFPLLENISDWFLFHRIALFEGIAYVPESLLALRVHNQTYTSQVKRNKKRRRQTYWHLLKLLEEKNETREKFKQAALLTFVFKELYWKLIVNPKYWDYLPYIKRKSRFKKSAL